MLDLNRFQKYISIHARLILAATVCMHSSASGQLSSGSKASAHPSQTAKETPPVVQEGPACPAAGVSPVYASQPGIGHHKVVLSWNGSVQASGQPGVVDGYCVYRSKKPNAAQKKASCNECEQVTAVAIPGTTCIDDLVEDGATYYYVVTAIRDKHVSSSSNEVVALIPAGPLSGASSTQSPGPPFCRGKSARGPNP